MGYPGSSLDDYYSYELIDKVIEQIESGDTGDVDKLSNRLSLVVEKFTSANKRIKQGLKPHAKRTS
jgi:hypothetical protein